MDAIITAGGIPKPEDPLYAFTQGRSKALLDIAGKPMIQWVLDAVGKVVAIKRVVIVGIPQDSGVSCSKSLYFVTNQGSMLENIRAGVKKVVQLNPQTEFVMLLSADIPAITHEMVFWVLERSQEFDADLFYSVIPREVMEARFPGSNRTYVRFKDIEVCGGDISILRAKVAVGRDEIWNNLIAARKNVLKQAGLIGYDTLLMLLLRRWTLEKMVKTISKRLDLKGKAVINPYAEVGMDVDKPFQLELVQSFLGETKKNDH